MPQLNPNKQPYIVVEATDLETLQKKVHELWLKGYKPYSGGFKVVAIEKSKDDKSGEDNQFIYFQTMHGDLGPLLL